MPWLTYCENMATFPLWDYRIDKYTYSCKSIKEKALVVYNSQQIPNNDIQRMLIIIISISLTWMHFLIISYLYNIPPMSFTTLREIRQTHTDSLRAKLHPPMAFNCLWYKFWRLKKRVMQTTQAKYTVAYVSTFQYSLVDGDCYCDC